MQKQKVYVIGVGMTKFEKPGRRENFDYPQMVKESVTKALSDAGVSYADVKAAAVGWVYGDSTSGQRALYEVGLSGCPIYNVNNNCSTGSTALMLAKQIIETGNNDCVLAVGFEKMERGSLSSKFDDRTNPMDKHVELMADIAGKYHLSGLSFILSYLSVILILLFHRFGCKPHHCSNVW